MLVLILILKVLVVIVGVGLLLLLLLLMTVVLVLVLLKVTSLRGDVLWLLQGHESGLNHLKCTASSGSTCSGSTCSGNTFSKTCNNWSRGCLVVDRFTTRSSCRSGLVCSRQGQA